MEARHSANSALQLSNGRDAEYAAAFALALAGDSSRAESLLNDLEKRFPEDSSVRFNYLPALRAQLALNRYDARKAIEVLQVAAPHDLAIPAVAFNYSFGSMYPVYARGMAYLALQQGDAAAAEFQKILDHRGITSAIRSALQQECNWQALMRCREIQLELRRRMKISCGFGQMPNPKFPSASTRGRSTRSCSNCKSIKNEPPEIASRCSEPFQSCMKEVLCFGD